MSQPENEPSELLTIEPELQLYCIANGLPPCETEEEILLLRDWIDNHVLPNLYSEIGNIPTNLSEDQQKEMLDNAYGGVNVLNTKGTETGRFPSS